MTRKDSEKETDRPHYYSQFWLDVAAGRTVIGAPKVEDEAELADTELELPEPTPLRKAGRSTASATDGYKPAQAQAVAEPALASEEFAEPEEDEFEQPDEVDDLELPNIVVEDAEEETAIPPEAEETEEQEEEEDLFYDEEEDEEEEEDEDSWGARGRKKPKPGRQVKPPKPLKKPKREPRRGF